MIRIPLTEAQLRLSELIASLQPGQEVQIFSGDVSRQAASLRDAARTRLRTVARVIGELHSNHPASLVSRVVPSEP